MLFRLAKSKIHKRDTLSARLLLPVILVAMGGVFLLAVSVALWLIHNNSDLIESYYHREAHIIAKGLANAVAPDLVLHNYSGAEDRLLQTASLTNVRSALVINMQGDVLSYVIGRTEDAPAHADFSLTHVSPPEDYSHESEQLNDDYLTIWHKVSVGTALGWVRIEIGSDLMAQTMVEVQREAWLLALAVIVPGLMLLGSAISYTLSMMKRREQEVANTEKRLKSKAYYDSLTGLPNRNLLYDRFDIALSQSARHHYQVAVCFLDLDDFKPVNDRYGHTVGDHLLMAVAQRLKETVRGEDTVARLGGDEFIVLLTGLEDTREIFQAVHRVTRAFIEPYTVGEHVISIQASIGYSLYPQDSEDAGTLIALADKAMYQAKSSDHHKIVRFGKDELELNTDTV